MNAVMRYEGNVVPYTAGSDIAAGDVIVQNQLYGIATQPIANGETGALTIRGIVSLPKGSGTLNAGAVVYWNASSNIVQEAAVSGKPPIGKVVVTSSGASVLVLLTPDAYTT